MVRKEKFTAKSIVRVPRLKMRDAFCKDGAAPPADRERDYRGIEFGTKIAGEIYRSRRSRKMIGPLLAVER